MMDSFLEVTDEKKQQSFTEVKLVREAFKLPENEQIKLEKIAGDTFLSKTTLIRIGLKMVCDLKNDELYKINKTLVKKTVGRVKAKK